MTAVTLRRLTQADDLFCRELSQTAGWNQTPADWRRARELEPEGAWLAMVDGREAGTVTTCRFGSIGWIALMLVSPQYRLRGVGRTLFSQAVNYLESHGVHSLRLDATPLGQPLYEQFGFTVEFSLERYAGRVLPDGSLPSVSNSLAITTATPADFAEIAQLDHLITATDRTRFLQHLFELAPPWRRIARDVTTGRLLGYSLSRPGRLAPQIGPCLAIDERAGSSLLSDALSLHVGHDVFVDIPNEHTRAVELARQHGLSSQRVLTRMGRGPRISETLAGFWSGSGPEKG
ncbi:MAG: GNAT family N-acetyltransferase [Pirellulales bacterium]